MMSVAVHLVQLAERFIAPQFSSVLSTDWMLITLKKSLQPGF
jgi:hypothetical protein